ncbi:MAG: UbiA prenyltransferase family protein [Candidatus Aenigmarchaeota archaeon]|nr:UbiA prenyltransferase family protein [Candidatus Aenigmarchaeota archaeon]
MEKRYIFRELISFTRVETSLFITGIAITGYVMFNEISPTMLFLCLSFLTGTGASYAYNHLTDKKEDVINNKKLNMFVQRNFLGKNIVVLLFAIGFVFSLSLPQISFIFYLLTISLAVAYSGLRIKSIFIIKNVFTGLIITFSFLTGAVMSNTLNFNVIVYLPIIFIFGITLNILGDIRGLEGDIKSGVKTIPAIFGEHVAKKVVYAITALFLSIVIIFELIMVYPLVPFMILISFFLKGNNHKGSRISILSSFVFFPVFAVLLNLSGGM